MMMKAPMMFSGTRMSSEKNLAQMKPARIMTTLQSSIPAKIV